MPSLDPIILVLKRYRQERGFSQAELARRTGISCRTMQRIENGTSDMTFRQYRKVIEILNLTDMDVSVSMLKHNWTTTGDIAAAARLLSPKQRKAIMNLILELADGSQW